MSELRPPSMTTGADQRISKRLTQRVSWSATAWLALVWVLLWGEFSFANVVVGILLGLLVQWALPLPLVPFGGRPSLLGVLRLLGRLALDIVVASAQVVGVALRFGREPTSAVLRVPLRSRSDLYLTLTADLCSVVPGSLIVEAHRATSTLYVHALDVPTAADVERARRTVLEQEARVLYALASEEEIREAGLPPRRLGGPGRGGYRRLDGSGAAAPSGTGSGTDSGTGSSAGPDAGPTKNTGGAR